MLARVALTDDRYSIDIALMRYYIFQHLNNRIIKYINYYKKY